MASLSGGSEPSTWSTIANPRFTTYERLQKCWQGPEGRILTGKAYQTDLDYELELFGIQGQPPHHIQTHSAVYQAEESASPPAFAGFSGGSLYQVDSIGTKPVYSLPDQPAIPVNTNPIQVYDPNERFVEKVDVFEQVPLNVEPLFVKGKRSSLNLDHDTNLGRQNTKLTKMTKKTIVCIRYLVRPCISVTVSGFRVFSGKSTGKTDNRNTNISVHFRHLSKRRKSVIFGKSR